MQNKSAFTCKHEILDLQISMDHLPQPADSQGDSKDLSLQSVEGKAGLHCVKVIHSAWAKSRTPQQFLNGNRDCEGEITCLALQFA
jgi:hypothetical protein